MKTLTAAAFALLAACCLLLTDARSEVGTGVVGSMPELDQARNAWKLHMVGTGDRGDKQSRVTQRSGSYERSDLMTKKGQTHGCFIWCVLRGIPKGPIEIKYSCSYGEASSEVAVQKAVHAFDSRAGICEREMPTIEYAQGGDL